MTAESSDGSGGAPPLDHEAYLEIGRSEEFQRLRRLFRRFVFPMSAVFLVWYLLYVLASAYARDLMGEKLVGNINFGLVFGLLQFASTFLIAWYYARYAGRTLDPVAERLREQNGGKRS